MAARRWVLTCDPGVDDAVALVVAAGWAGRRLRAVVAGAGNVPAATAWRNAAGLVSLLGLGVPVGLGTGTATDGTPIHRGPSSHGADGLVGLAHRLPARRAPAIAGAPLVWGQVLATGPLTDVAGALRAGRRVERVVWMGGSVPDAAAESSGADERPGAGGRADETAPVGGRADETAPVAGRAGETAPVGGRASETASAGGRAGQTAPVAGRAGSDGGSSGTGTVAEFNAAADLAAVRTVLASPADVAVVPIEVTRQVTIRPGDLDRWRGGSSVSRWCADVVARRLLSPRGRGGPPAFALHDPVAVVAALEPGLFDWSTRRLAPATAAGPQPAAPQPAGRLVVQAGPPNARLATAVDVGAVRERIVAAVAAAGR